jgi:hypothetical protein
MKGLTKKIRSVGIELRHMPELFDSEDVLIRLGLWTLTEYKTVLVIEPFSVVVQDIEHLFRIPVQFAYAATHNQVQVNGTKGIEVWEDGSGVMLLHPCRAVYEHMLKLLNDHPPLQFTDRRGEQKFIDWYFKYESLTLPALYQAYKTKIDYNSSIVLHVGSHAVILRMDEYMDYSVGQVTMLASYPQATIFIECISSQGNNYKAANQVRRLVACKV